MFAIVQATASAAPMIATNKISFLFMTSLMAAEVFTICRYRSSAIPDISRVEVAAGARRRAMKLYYGTANGPQRSGCGQIGSPEG
jgi:hypothetical protein